MPQIGAIEVVCVVLLLIGPGITKMLSCLVLSSLVMGGLYFMYVLEDNQFRVVTLLFTLFLLLLRLNMYVPSRQIDKGELVPISKKKTEDESKKDK